MSVTGANASLPSAVFLDRDGTVIVERHYLNDPAGVTLESGAVDGLLRFAAAGVPLVIVTNQAGIGRGFYTEADYAQVTRRLVELLAAEGIALAGIYHCPHAPAAGCRCRKPAPAMVERAAAELGLAPERAVVIGDKAADIGLAHAVGASAVLVTTGYGVTTRDDPTVTVDAVVPDLAAAAALFGL